MFGSFKIKECNNIHPMYLHYGTFGTRNIKEGQKLYFEGKYYDYKDIYSIYRRGIDRSLELLRKKFPDPIIQNEQIGLFNSIINSSDLKYTIEFGTIVDVSIVIERYCQNEKCLFSNSPSLDELLKGLKISTYISFACACVTIIIGDESIDDNEKQRRIDSIMEDFVHVQQRLQP